MSRFTEADITKSNTATRKGVDNSVALEHRKNIPRLLGLLDKVEAALGEEIDPTSLYRSPALNKLIGGSQKSAHSKCLAADFKPRRMGILEACKTLAAKLDDFDQIIYEFGEAGWVHVGLSEGPGRRQCLTATKVNGKTVYLEGFV